MFCEEELLFAYLQGVVPSGAQFCDAARLDIEPDGREMLAEFHGERQADVAEADDAEAAVVQIEHAVSPRTRRA